MLLGFFDNLRAMKVPVGPRELLELYQLLQADLPGYDIEAFYHLSRMAMVKDEKYYDRFDRAFAKSFSGLADISPEALIEAMELPAEWLEKLAEKLLSPEEKADIAGMGDFDKLMQTLRERLAEQQKRHQGGSKWVGTAGTSPFGAYGYNPEGVRIGQKESRHQRAVKVWDKREFRDLDGSERLGTRNIKLALKSLRQWARDGAQEELDLPETIRSTARQGYIDVKLRPERRNAIKLLLFFDVGGSMDAHIAQVEELFSAARAEFKMLEYYYFHNCPYEALWKNNRRRWGETTPTWDILNTYGPDYRVIFVGDASMSPYEIAVPGGANEYWNEESGEVWLGRLRAQWPNHVWLNPVDRRHWDYTQSIGMIRGLFEDRMYPLTLEGLNDAIKVLK